MLAAILGNSCAGMSLTKVQIANMALRMMGASRIESLTENEPQAQAINDVYELSRKELLRALPWRFAINYVELANTGNTPILHWSQEYQLPQDVIKVLCLNDPKANWPFEIVGDKLLCDDSTAKIKYIQNIEDTSKFDVSFAQAFASLLASKTAKTITGQATVQREMYQRHLDDLANARTYSAQETYADDMYAEDFITVRY